MYTIFLKLVYCQQLFNVIDYTKIVYFIARFIIRYVAFDIGFVEIISNNTGKISSNAPKLWSCKNMQDFFSS